MNRQRIAIGAVGVVLGLYGVFRLLTEIQVPDLELLAAWLIAAVVLHDGIISPVVAGLGWLTARYVPRRARRFLQPTLIVGGLITVIALPMIYRQGTLPDQKAILRQDYRTNLAIALGILVAVLLLGYVVQLLRDRSGHRRVPGPRRPLLGRPQSDTPQRVSATNDRPPDVQDSTIV
ncbi:MAG: hypothetical protein ACR2LX_04150 [Jatrophihabitans sp.]